MLFLLQYALPFVRGAFCRGEKGKAGFLAFRGQLSFLVASGKPVCLFTFFWDTLSDFLAWPSAASPSPFSSETSQVSPFSHQLCQPQLIKMRAGSPATKGLQSLLLALLVLYLIFIYQFNVFTVQEVEKDFSLGGLEKKYIHL